MGACSGLRVVFFGSGGFARPILRALLDLADICEVCAVVTLDNQRVAAAPFSATGIEILTLRPRRLDAELFARLRAMRVDLFITASYGLRFPRAYLDLPRYGSYNLHASLLPRWRGASPIQHSILHGDVDSGVTLISMGERIDCGRIVCQSCMRLGSSESYIELESRLSELAARDLLRFLREGLFQKADSWRKQDEELASYAGKFSRADGFIDWGMGAEFLSRRVRAFALWPGSAFFVDGVRVLVHEVRVEDMSPTAGSVVGEVLRVAPHPLVRCGTGVLGLLRLQREGRKVMLAADFLRGFSLRAGMVLNRAR